MSKTIKQSDFPFYEDMINSAIDAASKRQIAQKFNNAVKGTDEQKYTFALMIQQLVRDFDQSAAVKSTEGRKQDTLSSCISLFTSLSIAGNMSTRYIEAAETMQQYTRKALSARKDKLQP
jgi:uncharacterized protein YejL (UPF0352 family)